MAAYPRESAFMPTIKCSQCGNEVEIAMMGSHICGGAPPLPSESSAPDLLGGAFASLKQTVWGFGSRAAPPSVDTSAANQSYSRPEQLTPASASTGSRTISPKTPTGRSGAGLSSDDDFAPVIADPTVPVQSGRPGGYGGFDTQPDEVEPTYGMSPNKTTQGAPNLLRRMNTIAPGPFEMSRRAGSKNAFAPNTERAMDATPGYNDTPAGNDYGMDSSATGFYPPSNSGSVAPPRVPRKNGYGGFGPPQRDGVDEFEPEPLNSTKRSETFPKLGQRSLNDVPVRPPSAPGSRKDSRRRPTNEALERPVFTREREDRPSFALRDESRPPPPRKSLIRPQTAGRNGPSINLAAEFGVGNPYHTPSVSQSSSDSGYSKTSQQSLASSNTSPARSQGSVRKPSDTSNLDALMDDLQSSMSAMTPKELPPSSLEQQAQPFGDRRARPDDFSVGPAVQTQRAPRPRSPLAPTAPVSSLDRVDPAIQGGRSRSPARRPEHSRQPSVGRSRGNCKACKLAITGKSISSADGRLTGRYHKACFVCTTCARPFSSSTFYVLDDQPYDAECYHRLNGSCCGTCGVGIEGQYLEDESACKHHPNCFRCGDCGQVLRDGYFEVNGKAYCERDAWRRTQQSFVPPGRSGRGGLRPPPNGRPGLPSGNRLGPPGVRPRMEKRMTRLGMM
ncbi:hypothetical protein BX600DRAFT_509923 [Xylariales sp. PMI_506]|nr:hypothetical protein BX600DRAFT_509923 [Xylariales sp. PMI_506]